MQFILKVFLFVAQCRQEDVKDGYDVHLLQPFIFFISTLMYPHVLGYVLMFVLEGELKSHEHAFVFMYV